MTQKDDEDFENSTNCWICDNNYVDDDVQVRDHCYIRGKYRNSPHRDRNIKVKFNHEISIAFYNLKDYESHTIIQELGKFNFKINVIPNGLQKHLSFNINNKHDSFQFLRSSLDR